MLRYIAVTALLGLVALLIYAATRPDSFRVQRSAVIKAPPEKVFALIDDFHAWGGWSPYEKLDPAMKRTYGGPARGPGATYAWESNGKAGVGRMEILKAEPARIEIRLEFIKPFAARNTAIFALVPEAGATRVTWTMDGPSPLVAKLMGLVFNMDKMVGGDFEKGLADLKALAEG